MRVMKTKTADNRCIYTDKVVKEGFSAFWLHPSLKTITIDVYLKTLELCYRGVRFWTLDKTSL
jgi:hypothetical protein